MFVKQAALVAAVVFLSACGGAGERPVTSTDRAVAAILLDHVDGTGAYVGPLEDYERQGMTNGAVLEWRPDQGQTLRLRAGVFTDSPLDLSEPECERLGERCTSESVGDSTLYTVWESGEQETPGFALLARLDADGSGALAGIEANVEGGPDVALDNRRVSWADLREIVLDESLTVSMGQQVVDQGSDVEPFPYDPPGARDAG